MPPNLTRSDIVSPETYEKIRPAKREEILALKNKRRVFVGPYAHFLFENKQTLWWQIQEMLRIEKGGDAQITEELLAYAPLVPQGCEWIATLMFEIEEAIQRPKILQQLGGVEKCVRLVIGAESLTAVPIDPEDRTDKTGKTSAVHFLRFPFTPEQKTTLLSEESPAVILTITHPAYSASMTIGSSVLAILRQDLGS